MRHLDEKQSLIKQANIITGEEVRPQRGAAATAAQWKLYSDGAGGKVAGQLGDHTEACPVHLWRSPNILLASPLHPRCSTKPPAGKTLVKLMQRKRGLALKVCNLHSQYNLEMQRLLLREQKFSGNMLDIIVGLALHSGELCQPCFLRCGAVY